MRIYQHGQLQREVPVFTPEAPAVIVLDRSHISQEEARLGLPIPLSLPDERAVNRFESHREYECLLLNIPDPSEAIEAPPVPVAIYYSAAWMVLCCDASPALAALELALTSPEEDRPLSLSQVLYAFLNRLTAENGESLEQMEEDIAALEDSIAEEANRQYNADISALRKKLLKQKRYSESLLDAMEDLEENPHSYWPREALSYFHLITNRSERLFRSVLNLRDYVTQVREAYQSQMDIRLNQIMKLFTVVTTVFLPLTLLVGWYGMNLRMPEYAFSYAYPVVIVLSILIIVACIVFFRKQKWF